MSEAIWRAHGLLNNSFQIFSPQKGGHRSGNDAIFLAASIDEKTTGAVADFGAGTGAAGFAVAQRCADASVHLIEIDEGAAEQIVRARARPENSHLSPRIKVHACDLTDQRSLKSHLGTASGELSTIIANPPFNDVNHRVSPNPDRARAHAMPHNGLELWIKSARTHLAANGKLHWITRPSALGALLTALSPAFGDIRICPIHGKPDQPAQRILVRATKNSRAALQIFPPFFVHNDDGGYTEQADAVLRGSAAISMSSLSG